MRTYGRTARLAAPGTRSMRRLGGMAGVGMAATAGAVLVFGAASCIEQDSEKPTEEDMKVVRENLLSSAPAPKFAVNADLEGKVTYVGVDVPTETVAAGKELKLIHYWKVATPPGDGWRLFVHIEGPNHQGFLNADHVPVGGKYPVSQWKAGEIIRDEHTITLPAGWAAKEVLVYTGLWRGPTRLTVRSGPSDGASRVLAATLPVKAGAAGVERKRYVARRVTQPPKLDGKLDDAAWAAAPSTGSFVNTMTGGPQSPRTEAKLVWDDKNLYIAFDNADTDAWSSLGKRDDKLWTQEADEIMIDANGNGRSYVELQIAPNGSFFDTYLPEYRKYEDAVDPKKKPFSWNSKAIVKVAVDGTLNKHDDQDRGWTVELALPHEDARGLAPESEGPRLPPQPGDVWRINLFRMDQPKGQAQVALGWSPPMVGDFHALDRFGELVFGDESGNVPAPGATGAAQVAAAGDAAAKGDAASAKSRGAAPGKVAGKGKAKRARGGSASGAAGGLADSKGTTK